MAEKLNPTTAEEKDISKAQLAQQPTTEAEQQPETGEPRQQPETGQDEVADQPDEGLQSETLAQQRTDIEGTTQQPKERAAEESSFIGTEGERDTSAELVELGEDDEFKPDGQ